MANWDEHLHPRAHGKFAHKGGGLVGGLTTKAKGLERMADVKLGGERAPGLTDQQFHERSQRVGELMSPRGQVVAKHATDKLHSDGNGGYTPERRAMHEEIVNHLYSKSGHVPNEGRALMSGGLGGAGKSTVLNKHMGIDTNANFLTLNPDDVKEEMAKRGMVPEVPGHPDLSPMERAALIHEESGHITQMLANKAYGDRKNVMWDITMAKHDSVQKRLDELKHHGYSDTHGVFVHVPADKSVQRILERYRRGAEDHLNGKGYGGRYVPPEITRAQATPDGSTLNRKVFEGVRHQFSRSTTYDNGVDGRAPLLVDHTEHRPRS